MNKIYLPLLIVTLALNISSAQANASSSKLLQQGVPVDIIEVDRDAIRTKNQNFKPKKLVVESKNHKLKKKKKK